MKSRLAGAQKGHGLLKKKADALQMRFRQILGKIIEVSVYRIINRPNETTTTTNVHAVCVVVVALVPCVYHLIRDIHPHTRDLYAPNPNVFMFM